MIKETCTMLTNEDLNETTDMKYLENFSKIFQKVYESDEECLNFKYEDSVN